MFSYLCTDQYLSDLEAGRRRGAPETLRIIAVALNIDPAWITRDA
ncbi:MAG: helix-turn-helix transcriptional regulator [Pseudomonadota bacterium]|nr:helix-turn-helix transcriptional regulator [Pseudomonadota bacterium]